MTAPPLEERATRLVALSADWPDLSARATSLVERIGTEEFRIAVVGEFKRGKSTLLNALLGRSILPTGVLPVTAVPIELSNGPDGATVVYVDRRRTSVSLDDLEHFTTDSGNPENRLGVSHVEAHLVASLLSRGLVLVDVPGIGSVHDLASEVAKRTYREVDGAVLVLSADAPLSADERRVAEELRGRAAHLFIVVNKCDRLTGDEVAEVRGFVARALAVSEASVFCVSARQALARSDESDVGDFAQLVAELERFVVYDLIGARTARLSWEIDRLARELTERANLERLAGELDLDDLETRIETFRVAARREQERFESERLALSAEVKLFTGVVRSRLANDALTSFDARKSELVANLPLRGSLYAARQQLEEQIESLVRAEFAIVWARESSWLDEQWQALAERHRSGAEERMNAVREVAAELFAVGLAPVTIPAIERRPDENLFRFVPSATLSGDLLDALRRVLPATAFRGRLSRRTLRGFRQELDKHGGRASFALSERLEQSWREFERSTREQIDEGTAAIIDALTRASRLRDDTLASTANTRRRLDAIVAEVDKGNTATLTDGISSVDS